MKFNYNHVKYSSTDLITFIAFFSFECEATLWKDQADVIVTLEADVIFY